MSNRILEELKSVKIFTETIYCTDTWLSSYIRILVGGQNNRSIQSVYYDNNHLCGIHSFMLYEDYLVVACLKKQTGKHKRIEYDVIQIPYCIEEEQFFQYSLIHDLTYIDMAVFKELKRIYDDVITKITIFDLKEE